MMALTFAQTGAGGVEHWVVAQATSISFSPSAPRVGKPLIATFTVHMISGLWDTKETAVWSFSEFAFVSYILMYGLRNRSQICFFSDGRSWR